MIDLRQLEQSVGYVALLPKRCCYRGYYKRRIPEIARKFGEQDAMYRLLSTQSKNPSMTSRRSEL